MNAPNFIVCLHHCGLELDIIMEFEDDIEWLVSSGFSRQRSSTTSVSLSLMKKTTVYRVLVMGGRMVGKTAIISQFMQDKFPQSFKTTVQEMHVQHLCFPPFFTVLFWNILKSLSWFIVRILSSSLLIIFSEAFILLSRVSSFFMFFPMFFYFI